MLQAQLIFLCPNYPATCVHEELKIDYNYIPQLILNKKQLILNLSQLILNKKQQLILNSVQKE